MWEHFTYRWEWQTVFYYAFNITMAFVLALPLGMHREYSERNMGFRTFPLVAIAACGYVLVGFSVMGQDSPDAKARLIQGLVTGIGFLGAGAIVKEGLNVRGTTTAASIWNTAAIGAAVGFERYEIAVLLAVLNFVVLLVLTPVGEEVAQAGEKPDRDSPAEMPREEKA